MGRTKRDNDVKKAVAQRLGLEGDTNINIVIKDSVINRSNLGNILEESKDDKDVSLDSKKYEEWRELLQAKAAAFNTRVADEEGFAKLVEGNDRTIAIVVIDGPTLIARLEGGSLPQFSEGDSTDADVVVKASSETLLALLKRELSPIKAYSKGELKVKASFRDLLMMKKFF